MDDEAIAQQAEERCERCGEPIPAEAGRFLTLTGAVCLDCHEGGRRPDQRRRRLAN
jgi:hypothetical protein